MKIQHILNEAFNDRRGWSNSIEMGKEQTVDVDGYKIKFNIFQESTESPQHGGWDEAPYTQAYLGDVVNVKINSIDFISTNFDIPDLDLELEYPFNNQSVKTFMAAIQEVGHGYNDREDREKFDKYFGNPLHNDPQLIVRMLSAVNKEAANAYVGEM